MRHVILIVISNDLFLLLVQIKEGLPVLEPKTSIASLSDRRSRSGDSAAMNKQHINVPRMETYPEVHNTSCGQDNDLAALQVSKSHLLLLYLPSAATQSMDLELSLTSFVPAGYQQSQSRVNACL